MPTKTKNVTYEYTKAELESLLTQAYADEIKEASTEGCPAKVSIHFKIENQYDALDRWPGIPVLVGATISIKKV